VTCHRFGFHSGVSGTEAGAVTPAASEKESGDKSPHFKNPNRLQDGA
jgi:hypothetical protein